MALPSARITWGGGLNADALPSELADGVWSGASNARPINGTAARIPGTTASYQTLSNLPIWLGALGSTVSSMGWWLVAAGATEVRVSTDYSTNSNITRRTEGKVISAATSAGTTVTVTTATAHGLVTTDVISVWGFNPSTYNGESVAVTKITNFIFTYVVAVAPATSPATAFGLYELNGTTQSFTSDGTRWTGGELGGVFFANHATDGLYYWGGSTSTRMRKVAGSNVARISRPHGNFIFQLAPTMSGTEYPYRIVWSTSTEPGSVPTSFTAAATNDSGLVDRTEGGECVDCLPLGEDLIIYKRQGRMVARNVGGNAVYDISQLPGTDGLLATDCVVDTPVGHVFLSSTMQVMLHTGGTCTNLSEGRVNTLMPTGSDRDNGQHFLVKNAARNEVWVYLASGATYATRALIWNWKDNTWGTRDYGTQQIPHGLTTLKGADLPDHPTIVNTDGKLAIEDVPGRLLIIADAFTSYVERCGLDFGDAGTIKNLQGSRWNFDATGAPTTTIEHGSHMTAAATPTYASSVPYIIGTSDIVYARATGGRFLALKATITSNTAVRTTDVVFTQGGKR